MMKDLVKKVYCPHCNVVAETKRFVGPVTRVIKGETITLPKASLFKCVLCLNEVDEKETSKEIYKRASNIYKKDNDLATTELIMEIRNKYNLSQREFSKILGIGEINIARYENGSLPTKSISDIIKSVDNVKILKKYFNSNIDSLSKNTINKLNEYFESIDEIDYNGNLIFNKEKYDELTFFFVSKGIKNFTAINACTFYADIKAYKQNNKSITGCSYENLKFSPIANASNKLLQLNMNFNFEVNKNAICYVPKNDFVSSDVIKYSENEIMNETYELFKDKEIKDIRDFFENVRKNQPIGKKINFNKAKTLI